MKLKTKRSLQKIKIFVGILIFVSITVILGKLIFKPKYETVVYNLENKSYILYVADEEKEHRRGLMFYKKKPKGIDGMLFIFEPKRYVTFWNKNTYLELEIYWINDEKIVGKTYLPSIKKSGNIIMVNSPTEVNKVVELIK